MTQASTRSTPSRRSPRRSGCSPRRGNERLLPDHHLDFGLRPRLPGGGAGPQRYRYQGDDQGRAADRLRGCGSGRAGLFWTYAPIGTFYDARSLLLLPDGGFNIIRKSDPKLTALIEQYATATSLAEQQAIGKRISDRVTELGWFTVAYDTTNFFLVSKNIDAKLTPFEAMVAHRNIKPAS